MGPFSQAQWPSWAYSATVEDQYSTYAQLPNYPSYLSESMDAYQAHQSHLLHHHMSRTTESKPRLSKEEVEVLEAEFQKNHKPNSSTKKALAESMRVDNARINNWFQNRRAREKKENNIRQYEARQKLEKEKADAVSGDGSDADRQRDLVASSAPFPQPRKASEAQSQSLGSPSDQSSFDLSSDATGSVHCADTDDACSPFVLTPQAMGTTATEQIPSDFPPSMAGDAPEQVRDYMAMSESSLDMEAPEIHTSVFMPLSTKSSVESFFSDYQDFMPPNEAAKSAPSFAQQMFTNNQQGMLYHDNSYLDHDTTAQPSPMSTGSQLKSPPPIDIASRRNRRPPPLTISGARSYSGFIPKTAADMARRGDQGRTMRRVASATGSVRITKPNVTPRSPFFERKPDPRYQMSRSPNSSVRGSAAPPTPDTPVVANQQGMSEGAMAAFAMSKQPATSWAVHDPTLKTPPTTPGMIDGLFNLNAGYGVSMPDDALTTPGAASFPGEFEMPAAVAGAPGYIGSSNGGSSQPETPSFGTSMGPACFSYFGGSAEYNNWSDASASAKSSPALLNDHAQFMNMTGAAFPLEN